MPCTDKYCCRAVLCRILRFTVVKALDLRKFTKASVNSLNGVIANNEKTNLDDTSNEEYEKNLDNLVEVIAWLEIDENYKSDDQPDDSGSTSKGCGSTIEGTCALAVVMCLVAVCVLAMKRRKNVK